MSYPQMLHNKWLEFPDTYRAEAIASILQWIALGESGVVIGGSGSGKTNIAGYIASRSDVRRMHLPGTNEDYLFLSLDLNGLPIMNMVNFYRTMLDQIQHCGIDYPELVQTISSIVSDPVSKDDALALYLALQRAHNLLIGQAGIHVIWLFDRFDEGCERLEADTLNSLRNLRDQFKDRLSYIAFTRYPLARLRPPAEYDEFHEIMVMHTCWIGPMNRCDGEWVAQQVMTRYATNFSEAAIATIYDLCGGLPAFLKIAFSALASGELSTNTSMVEWQEKLLALPAMWRNCEEIWDSCSEEEQTMLASLAARREITRHAKVAASYLEPIGFITSVSLGNPAISQRRLFSPLFAKFIRQQQCGPGQGIHIAHGIVYQDGEPLSDELSPLEFRLLEYLWKHADEVCTRQDLTDSVDPNFRF
ncbi:hypothetical protein KFU94_18330 [Chloroflexi bacterium TSY]|nr:hypothetical protein [Chloroflexi bacterium TSY]